ncbi:tape measure protein [Bacteroides sp. KFT8]|uniref:tape measure protein n=1 Tax=Bacteroides sp. KFT8 TaxID=2025659 RepID=UPI000C046421|nr:tape measure protein [Bacteroides sp. KFT8]
MAKLYFKVGSDWEEVVKLRNEISKLKQELKSMDSTQSPAAFKTLNTQLAASTQRMDELVTNAAKAGAVMEGDFKKKIFTASQSVNGFIEKIITQKAVVKDVEADVKRLGEAYRSALKNNPLSANSKLSEYASAKKALDEEKAALFGLTQEQANARLSVKKLRDEYALYKNDGKQVVETNDGMAISWKRTLAVIGGVAALKQLGSEIIRVRGEFQAADTAIQTLLGSKEKADALMKQVREYAKISPLEFSDVTAATQMMLGFNIEAEKVPRFISAIGDVSMGEAQKFNSLTLAFSQMSATGKLMGQDLNQMINAGFNPLQQIALTTGKSIATLKEEMSKGAISTEMVQKAFIDATSAGGKFYQMSENASKTINGQLSMMQDAMDAAFNEMGQKSEGIIMSGIQLTTSLIENYETIGKVLIGMIATYGVYKTALITNIVLTRGWAIAAQADATAKGIQTIATKAQTVAQLALNAAMKVNPYVLAATLIVGVATAMWALHDSTTEAEKAQKRFNKKKADSLQKEEEHKSRLEDLIATIQNEYTSSMNRVKAIEAIKKEYPSLFQKYIDEKGHIKDLIGLWKEYNEEVTKNKVETNKKNLSDSTANIEEYEKMLSLWKKLGENPYYRKKRLSKEELELAEKYKGETESSLRRKLELAKPSRDLYQKDVRSDELAQWQLDLKKNTDVQIKSELNEMKRLQQARKNNKWYSLNIGVGSLKGITTESELQSRLDVLESELKSRKTSNYKEDYEKAKKDWEDAKKQLSEIEKDKSKFTSKQHEEAKKREETAEKVYKKLGGLTGSKLTKEENQAEKLRKEQEKYKLLLDKQNREKERMEIYSQYEMEQIEINGLQEGSEKVLRQRKLNHEKELEAIKREAEDKKLQEIEKARSAFEAKPDNKGKSFDVDKFVKSEPVKKQFTSFDKIADAKTKTENTKYNRGDDLKELLDKYQNFNRQRLKLENEYQEDEKILQDRMLKAKTEDEKKEIQEVMDELAKRRKKGMQEISKNEIEDSGIWKQLMGDIDALSTETLEKLLSDAEQLVKVTNLSATDMKAMMDTINNARQNLIMRNPFKTLKEEYEKYQKAVKKGDKQGASISWSNVEQASESIKNNISALGASLASLGNTFSNELGDGIQKAVDVINDGITAFEVFGKKGEKSAGDTVKGISGIIGIITTLIGTVMDAFDTTAEEQARNIEYQRRQEGYWDSINYQVERYLELLKEATASDYFELAGKSLTTLEESRRKAYQDIVKSMPVGDVDGTTFGLSQLLINGRFASKMTEQNFGAKTAKEIFDFINANGGYDLENKLISEDAIWAMKNNADIWSKLPEWMQEAINKFVELNDQAKELEETLNEDLFQTTSENIEEAILEGLKSGKRGIADFGEDFEEIMRNALLQSFVIDQLRGKAQDFYKKYTLLADSDKNGKLDLTADEISDLRKDWNDIIKSATEEAKNIDSIIGSSSSSSQESTKKDFATASQDSIDELNGRFTAGQIAWEETKNQNILQSQSLNILTVKADSILSINTDTRNIADEIRTIQANSFLELQGIRENTGAIIKPIKDMAADIAEVKKNTSKL